MDLVRRRPQSTLRPDRRASRTEVRVVGVSRSSRRTATRQIGIGCGGRRRTELLAERADAVVGVCWLLVRRLVPETGVRQDRVVRRRRRCLPIATDAVRVAVYVATLHHLPSRGLRVGPRRTRASPRARRNCAGERMEYGSRPVRPRGFDTTVDWTLPAAKRSAVLSSTRPLSSRSTSAKAPSASSMSIFPAGNCYNQITASDA